jgi:hypothetical protein
VSLLPALVVDRDAGDVVVTRVWTETAHVFHSQPSHFFQAECDHGRRLSVARPVKQPRQRHFQLNMIVGDINPSGSHLAKGADAKRHPVCRPRLFLHREHGKTGGGPYSTPV